MIFRVLDIEEIVEAGAVVNLRYCKGSQVLEGELSRLSQGHTIEVWVLCKGKFITSNGNAMWDLDVESRLVPSVADSFDRAS
jgi:hypothetical protein